MSRTDRHAPYWTWAAWYEPSHSLWCNRRFVCNLTQYPVRHAGKRPNRTTHMCTWGPVWPSWREHRWLMMSRPPGWFIKHVWSGPERVRKRDKLGKMVKEYNATGELEDGDFPNYQSRHCAQWLWD